MRKLIVLLVLVVSPVLAARHVIPWDAQSVAAGKTLYLQKCATCHGEAGDGQGPAADNLDPKPRDFRHDAFLYGSADDDLYATVWYGPSNRLSAMPAFQNQLTERQVLQILAYVKKTFMAKNPHVKPTQ